MSDEWRGLVERVAAGHGYDAERLGVARIRRACERRCEALGLATAGEYAAVLAGEVRESARLLEELAVCETWFFRQPVAMFAVARRLAGLGRPVRVLSAPCATGEEAYSIAVALADAGIPPADISIDAIDQCQHALATARAARYPRRSFRGERAPDDPRRFTPLGADEWRVRDEIARTVRFAKGDLRDPTVVAAGSYDAVFCCHLLIYFAEAARDRLVSNLATWLAPEGWLVVGPSEASALQVRGFVLVDPAGPILRARPAPAAAVAAPTARPVPERPSAAGTPDRGIRNHLARARRLADAGHTSEAAAICRQLREMGVPDDAELWCLVGVIELSSGRRAEARAAFHRAVAMDANHAEARHFCALLGPSGSGARA